MKRINLCPAAISVCFFSVCFMLTIPVKAGSPDDGCFISGLRWIEKIKVEDSTILKNHASAKCRFADKWIRDFADQAGADRRRMCNDLVLIWTHKECIYFRDYIHHSTYAPCKAWSREMFQHCMDYDDQWFAR